MSSVYIVVSYRWTHLESGKTGVKTTNEHQVLSRLDFLELLNKWNRDPRWKYCES